METIQIRFLSERNPSVLKELMLSPDDLYLSGAETDDMLAAKDRLDHFPEILFLLELYMVTVFLLNKSHPRDYWSTWLKTRVDTKRYLPRPVFEQSSGGGWTAVPVLLVNGGEEFLRYFILGKVKIANRVGWPDWADSLMDDACKKGIIDAALNVDRFAEFSPGEGFFCYPLTYIDSYSLTGGSLGLPLSLAMINLMTGVNEKTDILATGCLDEKGRVLPVGCIEEKIRCAGKIKKNGFKAVFYPSDNDRWAALGRDGVIEAIPVSNVEEARMFEAFYEPEGKHRLILFSTAIKNIDLFVNNCQDLDIRWLKWGTNPEKLKGLVGGIVETVHLLDALVGKIRKCADENKLELAELLISLVSSDAVDQIEKLSSLSAFKFCNVVITIFNHRGKITDAKRWSERASRIVKDHPGSGFEEIVGYYNHEFIRKYHNHYNFRSNLPEDFGEIFGSMEEIYRNKTKFKVADQGMGKLYGSVAQNFGFCGPKYLNRTVELTKKSIECFGQDGGYTAKRDRLRQLNYMIYAYLDADRMDASEATLLAYFDIESLNEIWPALNHITCPWAHAVLARFFADRRDVENGSKLFNTIHPKRKALFKPSHPWQLWALNLGRIAETNGRIGESIELYRESLTLCMSKDMGATVRMMALLPLSRLWQLGDLAAKEMAQYHQTLRGIALSLNPNHFRQLIENRNFSETMEFVLKEPVVFFPFTYR